MLEEKDIGKNILRYLTSGLYPDPRDAIREYIQNAVDGGATQVDVYIKDDEITIEDNGNGMTKEGMQAAARLAISDKDPNEDIGYKGIGIYSALSLAENLRIESRVANGDPHVLKMNFSVIDSDVENDSIDSLLKVLNNNLKLYKDLKIKDLSPSGTRIILSNITKKARRSFIEEKAEMKEYLQNRIPLEFDPSFKYRRKVETEIKKYLKKAGNPYRAIALKFHYDEKIENLYRPYTEEHNCQAPEFFEIKLDESFGIAWGCMREERKIFSPSLARGFLFKKHGITIGDENTVLKFFKRRSTFFNRYIGEFIIINDDIQPNAARDDIEVGNHYYEFIDAVKDVSEEFEALGNAHQENSKAREEIEKARKSLIEAKSEKPLSRATIDTLGEWKEKLENRQDNNKLKPAVINELKALARDIGKFLSKTEEELKSTKSSSSKTSSESKDNTVSNDSDISNRISNFKNNAQHHRETSARKIEQLYNSLCEFPLSKHSLFCYMGALAFLEVLAKVADAGKTEKFDLDKCINKKIRDGSYDNKQEMHGSWANIRDFGHGAKHSTTRFPENADQLEQDMVTLKELILSFFDEIPESI